MKRIILLRGLGRDQLHWSPLIDCLNSKSSNLVIETPDIPGAGILHRQKSPLNILDYIPKIEAQLGDNTDPATLVGLSFGGMIALKWAELSPNKFKQVVLINSSSQLSPPDHRLQLHHAIRYPGTIFSANLANRERAIFQLTCNTRPVDNDIIEHWVKIQKKHPVSLRNQLRQIIAASRLKLPTPNKLPPIHILNSLADRLVNPKCSQNLIDYYQASYNFHEEAGHDLSQDAPQWVANELLKL